LIALWPRRRIAPIVIAAVVLSVMVFWSLIPFYFLVVVPLRPPGSGAMGLELPKEIDFGHFRSVLSGLNSLWRYLWNSCVASGGATALVVAIAFPAAYAVSRFKSRASKRVYFSFFLLRTFPPIALVIPYYLVFSRLRLLDTIASLIIVYIPIGLPLAVWLLKGFFDMVPSTVEEAAKIDGASTIQIFVHILFPVMKIGVAITGAFVFLMCYIDYIYCVTLTERVAATFSMYIAGFIGDHWIWVEDMVAAALVGLIPLILLFSFLQKYIKKGIVFGAM